MTINDSMIEDARSCDTLLPGELRVSAAKPVEATA